MNHASKITVYSSDSPLRQPLQTLRAMSADLYSSRGLIWVLFQRDLKGQFRQSLLGYVWLFFPSIATAAVWFFLQSQRILEVETDIPYPIFVLIGTTLWISFVRTLNAPLLGFNGGKQVYTKLNVPVEAFVFSAIFQSLLEFLIRSIVLIPIFLLFKFVPPATAFLYPLGALSLFAVAISLGVLMIPIGSLYEDVGKVVQSTAQLVMYLAPVVYPLGLKSGLLDRIMRINPVTPSIAWTRDLLTTGSAEWALRSIVIMGISLVLLVMGLVLLRVARPHLVARMGM